MDYHFDYDFLQELHTFELVDEIVEEFLFRALADGRKVFGTRAVVEEGVRKEPGDFAAVEELDKIAEVAVAAQRKVSRRFLELLSRKLALI